MILPFPRVTPADVAVLDEMSTVLRAAGERVDAAGRAVLAAVVASAWSGAASTAAAEASGAMSIEAGRLASVLATLASDVASLARLVATRVSVLARLEDALAQAVASADPLPPDVLAAVRALGELAGLPDLALQQASAVANSASRLLGAPGAVLRHMWPSS